MGFLNYLYLLFQMLLIGWTKFRLKWPFAQTERDLKQTKNQAPGRN